MTRSSWSVPETTVVQTIRDHLHDDRKDPTEAATTPVLATIVDVEGSAYRRPGAKMLIDEDGFGVGAITAGCLEDELVRAAANVRESGRPELVTYDLMEDDDDVWGLGVGCNGIIDVLLEPLTDAYAPVIAAFEGGRDVAACTVLTNGESLSRGERAYYLPDEGHFTTPDGKAVSADWPTDALTEAASTLAASGKSDVLECPVGDETQNQGQDQDQTQTLEIFVDGVAAPAELVIFGTGHDVGPLTELGVKNDFRVTVVSFRGGIDVDDRFPDADRSVTTSPGKILEDVELDDRTYAVVMTHNFIDDQLTVEALLESPVPYIGLMGPHERFTEMLEAFESDGWQPTAADLERIYTPIGLDLGGGSPYQIAHSIVAELLVVDNDRQPVHLRERDGHIHERVTLEPTSD